MYLNNDIYAKNRTFYTSSTLYEVIFNYILEGV